MATTQTVRRAALLAAGRGTRLGALTANRPKPMVPVGGKPALERIITGIAAAGIGEFLIVVGYRGEAIRDYFGDGARWDLSIQYAEQPVPQGTGAALLLARDFAADAPILMSYGDILTDPAHYRALRDEFEAAPCAGVLGINWMDDPAAGAAVYREGARVVRVQEKPPPGTAGTNWNLAGVNVCGPEFFPALAALKPSPRGEYELTSAIAALLESGHEIRAVEMRGFWSDIGTPEELRRAEEFLKG